MTSWHESNKKYGAQGAQVRLPDSTCVLIPMRVHVVAGRFLFLSHRVIVYRVCLVGRVNVAIIACEYFWRTQFGSA